MKKLVLVSLLFAALLIVWTSFTPSPTNAAAAATVTPLPTSSATNTVQGFLVVCSDSVIINFSGTMLAGYGIDYQVFSGSTGSGTAITAKRHVSVSGSFAVSDRALYTSGVTVASGGTASAKVYVTRNSTGAIAFSFVLSDVQDGCNNPQNPFVSTADLGTSTPGSGTTTTTTSTSGTAGVTVSILAPNGGTLNPNLAPEGAVVVGARPSDRFRSQTPGLIFAQCDAYPLAEPGIIYDDDTITIFWSWFTKTQAEMSQELANAVYTVHLNTAPLPMTTLSAPAVRDGNVWVFYTATVGNLRPGHYEVGFLHTWLNPVNDGYNDYGPGTSRPTDTGTCNFDVLSNPDSVSVAYSGMYFPSLYATHNLHPDR